MGKNKGGEPNFNNRACRKFKDNKKMHLLPQSLIFEILDEDVSIILKQLTDYRNHTDGAKYPTYTSQMFANLSVPLYFYEFVKDHVKVKKSKKRGKLITDLTDDEVESLKLMLADAYKRSASNQYAEVSQEFEERNELLSETFSMLDPKGLAKVKKFGLSKSETRDILIQIYGDPVHNMKYVRKLVDGSAISDKKKIKLLKKLYGDRFAKAVGAALTVESNKSDCVSMLFDYVMDMKLKKRAPYVMAYAEAYKENQTRYFRVNADFGYKNRKLIKELKKIDIGFKKAFKNLKGEVEGKSGKKKDKSMDADIRKAQKNMSK